MCKIKKSVFFWKCKRCKGEWLVRYDENGKPKKPTQCNICRSPFWDKDYKNKRKG